MEDTTILEVDTSNVQPEAVDTVADTNVGEPTIVEQATPMDNNVSYDNLPKNEIKYDASKDFTQNLVQDAMHIEHDNSVISNNGVSMNKFLTKDYDYDQNEAGSYWVAGAINDVNTQMNFLNALIYEEMYDEMDLQKYYYDTTMATARAYAAQKEKETAYGYYRAAQQKAIAEAQLTGWYMPAEGQYMLMQYETAQAKLQNPDIDDAERAKAQRISATTEQWFNANKITTRGIKCLSMMNYEENVRHNTIMGELQKQANAIAASGAAASSKSAEINLREFKFQVEEMELQYGYDFTKEIGLDDDSYIGHDIKNNPDYAKYQALQGGKDLKTVLKNSDYYQSILTTRNTQWLKEQLGDEYETYYDTYQADLGDKKVYEAYTNGSNVVTEDQLDKKSWTIAATEKTNGGDKKVYTFSSTDSKGKAVTRCYYKDNDGVYHQITSKNFKLAGDKTIGDYVKNFSSEAVSYDGQIIGIGNIDYSSSAGSSTNTNYAFMGEKQLKTVREKEQQGYRVLDGAISTQGINANVVMYKVNDEGKTEYFEVSNTFGDFKQIKEKQVYLVPLNNKEGTVIGEVNTNKPKLYYNASHGDIEKNLNGDETWVQHADTVERNLIVENSNDNTKVYSYRQPNGDTLYMKLDPTISSTSGNLVVISAEEAKSHGVDVDANETNRQNYQEGLISTTNKEETKVDEDDIKSEVKVSSHIQSNVSGSSGYDVQNTVTDRTASFNKYNPLYRETPEAKLLRLKEEEERKTINDLPLGKS